MRTARIANRAIRTIGERLCLKIISVAVGKIWTDTASEFSLAVQLFVINAKVDHVASLFSGGCAATAASVRARIASVAAECAEAKASVAAFC